MRLAMILTAMTGLAATAHADPAASVAPAKSGLHVTFGVGGAQHTTLSTIEGFDGDIQISGYGIGGMLAVGYTLAPGVVLGGGAMGGHIFSPSVDDGEAFKAQNDLIFLITGIYADYSFDPAQGVHLQVLLGFATLEEGADDIEGLATGFGATIGAGYRFPVSAEWSLGVLARMQVLATSAEYTSGDEVSNLSLVPALLASVTWH